MEREARGQPWGKGSSTDGNNTNLHDQKHTEQLLLLLPLQPRCPFLPQTLQIPCVRWEGGYSLVRDHKHISHRAEQALQNRSHCPQKVHLSPSVHKPFLPAPFKFSGQGDRGCWVFNLLLTASHTNLGFNIWIHFLPLFFFLNTLLKPSC